MIGRTGRGCRGGGGGSICAKLESDESQKRLMWSEQICNLYLVIECTYLQDLADNLQENKKQLERKSGWPEQVVARLHMAGLTRGRVAERTVALLLEAGVEEWQVSDYVADSEKVLFS